MEAQQAQQAQQAHEDGLGLGILCDAAATSAENKCANGSDMELVDVFCGVGGFTAGARGIAIPILGIDNDDLMVRLWAGNSNGRGLIANLWEDSVDWPPQHRNQHVHISPPCTTLSKAQRNKSNTYFGIDYLHTSLEFLCRKNFASWSLETVSTPVVRSCLHAYKDAHPEFDLAWAVLDAAEFGSPSTRVRIIAGPNLLVQTLRQTPVSRVSVEEAFKRVGIESLPAQHIKNNSLTLKKKPCIRHVGKACHTQTASHPLMWCTEDGKTVRCLTVRETALIMGFPEDWMLPSSSRAGIQALGNSVPPPLSKAILSSAMACLAA